MQIFGLPRFNVATSHIELRTRSHERLVVERIERSMDVVVTKRRIDNVACLQPRLKTKKARVVTVLFIVANTAPLLTGHK